MPAGGRCSGSCELGGEKQGKREEGERRGGSPSPPKLQHEENPEHVGLIYSLSHTHAAYNI